MAAVTGLPLRLTEGDGFSRIPGVRAVPIVTDWRTLTRDEFLSRAEAPLIFKGLGAGARAGAWDRESFRAFGDELVQMRAAASPDGAQGARRTVALRDFIAALDAGAEGVYAAEWYLFKAHPELLDDVVAGFPEYLLDDWLESVPPPLQFDSNTRNNVYWGATGSTTPVHYDSLNACTWNLTLKGVKRWLLFPARAFGVPSPQCWDALRAHGLLAGDGRFTPAAVRAYLDAPPAGFPAVTFYAADVGPGDAIYVPWRWAHQVENIGESMAVSRFYVSRENYDAAIAFFRKTHGAGLALLLRALMGTGAARAFFRRPDVRRWLASGRSSAALRRLMRLAMGAKTPPQSGAVRRG